MSNTPNSEPAAKQTSAAPGWFTMRADNPALIGNRCTSCATIFFPKKTMACGNPSCNGRQFEDTELSSTGTIWSFTDMRYAPPPPYIRVTDPYEPITIAAVTLDDEKMVVLGQMTPGVTVTDLRAGMRVRLVVEPLFTKDGVDHMVWRWKLDGDNAGDNA